jgi:hypothetical protein
VAQFLLSVWHDDTYEVDFSSEDAQRRVEQVGAFNAALEDAGALLFAGGLHPKETAAVARWDNDAVSVSAGAFSAAPEQMGGFWIIEAADAASAQEWARRGSAACEGAVEVRALQGE